MVFVRFFLIAIIAMGTYLILDLLYTSSIVTVVEATPVPKEDVQGISTITKGALATKSFDQGLSTTIDDALAGTRGTYAVYVKDLTTDAVYTKNANRPFATASLYKLWVMVETYQQIREGKFSEDTELQDTVANLNDFFDIASESAELTEGEFTMSVAEALKRMITISHNYAAYLLTKKITLKSLDAFVKDNGFASSRVNPDPETTASDMALFLEKLYRGQLGTPEDTKKMLDLMADQQINDRIPKYLPNGTKVMHKTGELDTVKHDVGIVSGPNGDYLIVLMSDTSDQLAAAERLANISRNVYDFMRTQPEGDK